MRKSVCQDCGSFAAGVPRSWMCTNLYARILVWLARVSFVSQSLRNIKILEANDYIGGRIQSLPMDNIYFDVGAGWIHKPN